MHYVEKGSGPVVLLLHGFPEFWFSWRHQIDALADAGYRVVVPDQRGYGQTDKPSSPRSYHMKFLTDDAASLLDALHVDTATLVGHDFGGVVALWAAYLHPDRFNAVASVSIPWGIPFMTASLDEIIDEFTEDYYFVQFQTYPVFENIFSGLEEEVFGLLYADNSKEADSKRTLQEIKNGLELAKSIPGGIPLGKFITKEELNEYVKTFKQNGITCPLNWYRNWERNQLFFRDQIKEKGLVINQPYLLFIGERDLPVLRNLTTIKQAEKYTPHAEELVTLSTGHWIQQEKPQEFNKHLINFLNKVHNKQKSDL